MTHTRLLQLEDAETLAALVCANRAYLAPWEPIAPEVMFTADGQRRGIIAMLRGHSEGSIVPHAILDGGRIVGRITLTDITRHAFQSCHVGYWVAETDAGRGHAGAALAEICALAFDTLGLHRIQAGTLEHNVRSQRVLERNGFTRIGLAPGYLKIAGRWQDHVLFQRLSPRD